MILPDDVLSLIREFSKPLTRPDWKRGTRHAQIFKYSEPMKSLKISFVLSYEYRRCWSYNILGKDFYDDDITMIDVIQTYGEEIFPIQCGLNFYIYARHYLKKTNLLQIKKIINNSQKYSYVWEYVT